MTKVGRNQLCPCGSGKKYKKCCLSTKQMIHVDHNLIKSLVIEKKAKANLPFNMAETENENHYYTFYNFEKFDREKEFIGYIKIKLAHGKQFSIIIPDILILKDNESLGWLQIHNFFPNIISKDDNQCVCSIRVDLSSGYTAKIKFSTGNYIRSFDDGSELYECVIIGSPQISELSMGEVKLTSSNSLMLKLFHHTTVEVVELIQKSGFFKLSAWNIQGTKKFDGIGFVYFTPIPRLIRSNDLKQIAMSSEGYFHLLIDGFKSPEIVPYDLEKKYPNEVIKMVVYRENTEKRTAQLELEIPAEFLSPQHLHLHKPPSEGAYYSICCPFIQRVGLDSDSVLHFNYGQINPSQEGKIRRFYHIVVGDCTTKEGLLAPYDEDTTSQLFKIEFVKPGQTILKFWFDDGNQDLFTGKKIKPFNFS